MLEDRDIKILVGQMLENIDMGKDPVAEINLTLDCLEALIDQEFTPQKRASLFGQLASMVRKTR